MNAPPFLIHEATPQDLQPIQAFLTANKLRPSIEISVDSLYYYIKDGEQLIATIGAEFNDRYALIRAAGVAQPWRRQGIANELFQKLVTELEKRGIVDLYLFSRQAAEFWTAMGFSKCSIQEVIDVLPGTPQVKEFIADNSIWTDVAWTNRQKI